MPVNAIKKLVPSGFKLRLREWMLTQYGIPFSRFDIPAPLVAHFRGSGPITIVDVGASSGEFVHSMSRFCGIRQALLVEPIPYRCQELRTRFTTGIHVVCAAAGRENTEMEMEIREFDYTSSLLPLKSEEGLHGKMDVSVKQRVRTPVRTLDKMCDEAGFEDPIVLLKIDMQGAEHLVLEGAGEVLQRVKAIWTEVSLRPLYEGSLTFEAISERCRGAGFMLSNLNEAYRGANGELLQGDALFIRPSPGRTK
jgi:FkbM family methyltransferase